MKKVKIEFINACSCCEGHGELLKEIGERFPEKLDVKVYRAGKDFDYLQKYGQILRTTMIVNEKDKYEDISRKEIEEIISKELES